MARAVRALAGAAVEAPAVRAADELRSLELAFREQRPLMGTAAFVGPQTGGARDEDDFGAACARAERPVRGELFDARDALPAIFCAHDERSLAKFAADIERSGALLLIAVQRAIEGTAVHDRCPQSASRCAVEAIRGRAAGGHGA